MPVSQSPSIQNKNANIRKSFDFSEQGSLSKSQQAFKSPSKFLSSGYSTGMQELSTEINDVYEFRKRCFEKIKTLESIIERNKATYENEIVYMQEYINLLKRKIGKGRVSGQDFDLACETCKEKNRLNSNLINEVEELRETLKAVEVQHQMLMTDNYNKRQEIAQLSRQLKQQRDVAELFEIISSLEETKKNYEEQIFKLQDEKKQMEVMSQQKNTVIEALENVKGHNNEDNAEEIARIKQTLQRKVEESVKMCEKKFNGVIERTRALDEESNRLEKMTEVLKEIQEKSRENIDNESLVIEKFKEVAEENSILMGKLDQAMMEKKEIKDKMAKIENEQSFRMEKSQKIKDELDCSIQTIKTLEDKLESSEVIIEVMKSELEKSKDIAEKSEKSEKILKDKCDSLIDEINSANEEKQSLKQELQNIEKKASFSEKLKEEAEVLKKEAANLNELIKALNLVNQKIEDDKNSLATQLEKQSLELFQSQEKLQENLSKAVEQDQKVKNLINQTETQEQKIESLEKLVKESKQFEDANVVLKQQIAVKCQEIDKLQEIFQKSLKDLLEKPEKDKSQRFSKENKDNKGDLERIKALNENLEGFLQDKSAMKYLEIIEELTEKIKDYVSYAECLEENLDDIKSQIQSHEETIADIENKLKNETNEKTNLEDKVLGLEKNIEEISNTAMSKSQEQEIVIQNLKQQICNKNSELEKLQEILQKSLVSLLDKKIRTEKSQESPIKSKESSPVKFLDELKDMSSELIPAKFWEIIRDLTEKLQQTVGINENLEAELKDSHAQITHLVGELSSHKALLEKLEILIEANGLLENTIKKDQKDIEQLNSDIHRLKAENEVLSKELQALKTIKNDMVVTIHDLKNDIDKEKAENRKLVLAKDSMASMIEEENEEKRKLVLKVEDLESRLENEAEEKRVLGVEMEKIKDELENEVEEKRVLGVEVEKIRDKLENVVEEKRVLSAEVEKIRDKLENEVEEKMVLSAEMEKIRDKLENEVEEKRVLSAEMEKIRDKLENVIEENKDLNTQVENIYNQLENEIEQKKELSLEVENMTNQLENEVEEKKSLLTEFENMKNQLEEKKVLDEKVEYAKNQLERAQDQLQKYEKALNELRNELELQKAEIEDLTRKLENHEIKEIKDNSRNEQLEKNIQDLMKTIDHEKSYNKTLEQKIQEFQQSGIPDKKQNDQFEEKSLNTHQTSIKRYELGQGSHIEKQESHPPHMQKQENHPPFIQNQEKISPHSIEKLPYESMTEEKVEALHKKISENEEYINNLQEKIKDLDQLPILINELNQAKSKHESQSAELDYLRGKLNKVAHLLPPESPDALECRIKTVDSSERPLGLSRKLQSEPKTELSPINKSIESKLKETEKELIKQDIIIGELQRQLDDKSDYPEILAKLLEANEKLDQQLQIIDELKEKVKYYENSCIKTQTSIESPMSEESKEFQKHLNDKQKPQKNHLAKDSSINSPSKYDESIKPSGLDIKITPKIQKPLFTEKMPESLEEAQSYILILTQSLEELQEKSEQSKSNEESNSSKSEIINTEKEGNLLSKIKHQNNIISELENKNLELESRFNRIRNKNNLLESKTKKYSENVEKVFKDVNKKLQIIEKHLNMKEEKIQNLFNDYMKFKKKFVSGFQERTKVIIESLSYDKMGRGNFINEGMNKDDIINLLKARVEYLQDKIDSLVKTNYVTKEIMENISDKAQDAIELINYKD
ncbi:hypothetical protein SteCoe_22526 [Stentor coeruleus]|uniref:Uncharacterized protein n=1 Tax=Stentor coeruleus TaxID=5963 RepID=A0A1R2BM37_9CILI|nr:hypothetical protein SteCoe_22526 [Stentor coeruleus]